MSLEIVMCPPKYIAARIPNNKWMEKIPPEKREINRELAMKQFFDVYSVMSQYAFVWLIPPKPRLQDQVYVSNAACALPHLKKTIILAKFKAEGRPGEEDAIAPLLHELGWEIYYSPYYFEGEADLKWVRDNLYIGGYAIRTEKKALEWLEQEFDCKILPVEKRDPYLYHLDCSVFPLSEDYVLVNEKIPKDNMQRIKKEVEVIEVSEQDCYAGITNSVRLGYTVFNSNNASAYPPDSIDYKVEIQKNQHLEEICRRFGLALYYFDLSEFLKSGALLSCMVLHLTYDRIKLTG
ncbi:MAG: arginine deiminase-related protein [Ignisphaera sp.]